MVIKQKLRILLFIIVLLNFSCITIERNKMHNYWEKENNDYSNLKINGFYYMPDTVISNEKHFPTTKFLILFNNGTVYGFTNININYDNKCSSFKNSLSRHMNKEKYISNWGAIVIKSDSLSIQRQYSLNGNGWASDFNLEEKKGIILNDTTFILTWYKNYNKEIQNISEKYHFVKCQKPDSLSWMLTDKKLNRLLERNTSKPENEVVSPPNNRFN